MTYTTVYKQTVKRRKTGKLETSWQVYQTKSLTPMHEHIRQQYPGAKTYRDVKRVITDFIPGMPLDEPIISGGTLLGG